VQECHLEPSPGPSTCISSQAILLVFVNCIIENLALQDKKKAVKSMVDRHAKICDNPIFLWSSSTVMTSSVVVTANK
jgi:hypothetical protein